jgi:hypothetical protein
MYPLVGQAEELPLQGVCGAGDILPRDLPECGDIREVVSLQTETYREKREREGEREKGREIGRKGERERERERKRERKRDRGRER